MLHVIDFAPPMLNLDGNFNTFRLGGAWAKRVQTGNRVALLDKKQMCLVGYAIITGVHTGKLNDLAALHGCHNHNQKHLPTEGAGDRVVTAMMKRYGPHKCRETSKVTVIECRRIEYEHDAADQPIHVREIQG